jgi:pilus assembly protein Flp/PilA
MTKFIAAAKGFVKGEEGATMVEYGLMVALIAVICIGAVTILGGSISGIFSKSANSVSTVNSNAS